MPCPSTPGQTRDITASKIIWSEYCLHTSSLLLCVLGALRLEVTQTHSTHEPLFLKSHYCSQNTASLLPSCSLPVGWQQELTHLILGRTQPRALGCTGRGKENVSTPRCSSASQEPGRKGHWDTMEARGHPWPSAPLGTSPVESPVHPSSGCTPSLSTPREGASSSLISPRA